MNVASYVLSFCKCPDKTKDPFEFEYDPDTVEVLRQIYNETNPKFVLIVLLEAPKTSEDYIYKLRNSNFNLHNILLI